MEISALLFPPKNRIASLLLASIVCAVVNSCGSDNHYLVDPVTSLVNSRLHPEVRGDNKYWEEEGRSLESVILKTVDKKRIATGRKPLKPHAGLAKLARKHSRKLRDDYVRTGVPVISHEGFKKRFSTISLDYNLFKASENVGFLPHQQNLDQQITKLWMQSKSHRENLLKRWGKSGVGVAIAPDGTVFVTQLFGLKTNNRFD